MQYEIGYIQGYENAKNSAIKSRQRRLRQTVESTYHGDIKELKLENKNGQRNAW